MEEVARYERKRVLRNRVVSCRVSEQEYQRLQQLASRRELGISEIIRERVTGELAGL